MSQNEWRLIRTGKSDGYFNMALDEAILDSVFSDRSVSTLRFYGWENPIISIGYLQKIEGIRNFLNERTDLVRRITGGGIVYHDFDLSFSITIKDSFVNSLGVHGSYNIISKAVADGLIKSGIEAEVYTDHSEKLPECFPFPQKYDIVSNKSKIYGAAQRRIKDTLLHQGTVKNISKAAACRRSIEAALENSLSACFGIMFKKGDLLESEKELAIILKNKYKSPAWKNWY